LIVVFVPPSSEAGVQETAAAKGGQAVATKYHKGIMTQWTEHPRQDKVAA